MRRKVLMKFSLFFTVFILILGSILYFKFSVMPPSARFFETTNLKAAITEKGELKLFALAKNNELSKLMPNQGENIPESETIILGYNEAKMMKNENLFEKIGDRIDDFFGINIKIGGILKKTDTIIDDMHFLSEKQFAAIQGEENKVFFKILEGMPKTFYTYNKGDTLNLKLKEGNFENYKIHIINGKNYYPLILGNDEAEMMIAEKLFKKPGDTMDGFFGKDVFIAGILEKTNTPIDMMHFLPFTQGELE